jgi:hypothetical protein
MANWDNPAIANDEDTVKKYFKFFFGSKSLLKKHRDALDSPRQRHGFPRSSQWLAQRRFSVLQFSRASLQMSWMLH